MENLNISGTDSDDGGTHRLIVTPINGVAMTEQQAQELRREIEALLNVQHQNPEEFAIVISDWSYRRGRLIITPGGPDALEDGVKVLRWINDRVRVNGMRFRGVWNHELTRVASLTIRFSGPGAPEDLIEGSLAGLARINRWPAEFRHQIRFQQLVHEDEAPGTHRIIRFEATPEVVQRILDADGWIFIGTDRGSVYFNKKTLTKNSTVTYHFQK